MTERSDLSARARRPSFRPSAPAAALCMLASASTQLGCSFLQLGPPSTPPSVRPAALSQNLEARHSDFPFALATEDDAIVRLVAPDATCTGTLIADDLVLTAKHCVVTTPRSEREHVQLIQTKDLKIEIGGDYMAWGTLKPRHFVVSACGEFGGAGDVAVIVLERKLVGVPTRKPRLNAAPKVGELVDSMGFGRCATSGGIVRKVREGGKVRSLTGETILLDAAICPGDSGGPALSRETGEVVGVVSMSAMDSDERTRQASVMARIDAYSELFAQARAIADGTEPNELPPIGWR
jgi:V8-like Glu-specific endopeptidase